ncbi:unnamed protein product [Pedinophyceae sp. YPF-701]|nr:unnamed protein product [Pedinophyceae sp. YPF-701]
MRDPHPARRPLLGCLPCLGGSRRVADEQPGRTDHLKHTYSTFNVQQSAGSRQSGGPVVARKPFRDPSVTQRFAPSKAEGPFAAPRRRQEVGVLADLGQARHTTGVAFPGASEASWVHPRAASRTAPPRQSAGTAHGGRSVYRNTARASLEVARSNYRSQQRDSLESGGDAAAACAGARACSAAFASKGERDGCVRARSGVRRGSMDLGGRETALSSELGEEGRSKAAHRRLSNAFSITDQFAIKAQANRNRSAVRFL